MNDVNTDTSTHPVSPRSPETLSAGAVLATIGTLMQFARLTAGVYTNAKANDFVERTKSLEVGNYAEIYAVYNNLRWILSISELLILVGVGITLWAVFRYKYRGRWLYWVMLISGLYHLTRSPIGTAMGVTLLATAIIKRKEFRHGSFFKTAPRHAQTNH